MDYFQAVEGVGGFSMNCLAVSDPAGFQQKADVLSFMESAPRIPVRKIIGLLLWRGRDIERVPHK